MSYGADDNALVIYSRSSGPRCRLVLPLSLLAYLPIRYVLQILAGAGRFERWTLWLAFGYLSLRLVLAY